MNTENNNQVMNTTVQGNGYNTVDLTNPINPVISSQPVQPQVIQANPTNSWDNANYSNEPVKSSNLVDFLTPLPRDPNQMPTRVIIVSDRLKNIPFTIRKCKQEEIDALTKKCRYYDKSSNELRIDHNQVLYETVGISVVNPNLKSTEVCNKLSTYTIKDTCNALFLMDEFQTLAQAIMDFNGIGNKNHAEIIGEDAKNF